MDIKTRKIIEELCTDLQAELDDRYQNRNQYSSLMDKYNLEMRVVRRAKALIKNSALETLEEDKNRYFVFYFGIHGKVGIGHVYIFTDNGEFPTQQTIVASANNAMLGLNIDSSIYVAGFDEFKSKEDYLAFKGE